MRITRLTPMHDPDIVRVLGEQTQNPVSLLPASELELGAKRVSEIINAAGCGQNVLLDCCHDRHLEILASGLGELPLITGGSGIARYFARCMACFR